MNERQAYLAIRNAIRLENLSDDIAQKVAPALRAIFNELGNQFRRMPPGNLEREIWYRQQRLRIADLLAPLSREMGTELRQRLGEEVAQQMHYAQSYLRIAGEDPANLVAAAAPQDGISMSPTAGMTGSYGGDGLSFTPGSGGGASVGRPQFTRTQLHAITQDVKVMGERLEDLFEPVIGRGEVGPWIRQNLKMIDTKVKAGFLTGQTADQIAAQIPGFGAEAIRRNKAIARTAVMDLSAKAQEAFWEANSDVVQGWEVDSTMDNRVCEKCAPWDGEFNKDRNRLPTFPLHVNCRCRVLPLTKTEMLLREEEGPQRRSVVELIEAPSKEEAIALAKAKPGVVAARAYAGQVKVDGKKYWRVAKDIVQKDHPLTMGEFLRQASPQTQLQVLGSKKRVSKFLGWISGKDGNTPMSPDLALKRVVEWKPTVSRQPRLSAEMKLEISKLKSQKELMKKNSEGEQHIVYGYIRGKDTRYGKAGSLYYVGISNDGGLRPYRSHRSGAHGVPVPKDERQIRQLAVAKNRAEAERIEIALIAREGRIPVRGKAGIGTTGRRGLLNVSPGGGKGSLGVESLETKRRKVSAANKYGIPLDKWAGLSRQDIKNVAKRYAKGIRGDDLIKGLDEKVDFRALRTAGTFGVDPTVWNGLSRSMKRTVRARYKAGVRGGDLLAPQNVDKSAAGRAAISANQLAKSAAKYDVPLSAWKALTPLNRRAVMRRHKKGLRGAALLEGLL
jgi:hypothetical protein